MKELVLLLDEEKKSIQFSKVLTILKYVEDDKSKTAEKIIQKLEAVSTGKAFIFLLYSLIDDYSLEKRLNYIDDSKDILESKLAGYLRFALLSASTNDESIKQEFTYLKDKYGVHACLLYNYAKYLHRNYELESASKYYALALEINQYDLDILQSIIKLAQFNDDYGLNINKVNKYYRNTGIIDYIMLKYASVSSDERKYYYAYEYYVKNGYSFGDYSMGYFAFVYIMQQMKLMTKLKNAIKLDKFEEVVSCYLNMREVGLCDENANMHFVNYAANAFDVNIDYAHIFSKKLTVNTTDRYLKPIELNNKISDIELANDEAQSKFGKIISKVTAISSPKTQIPNIRYKNMFFCGYNLGTMFLNFPEFNDELISDYAEMCKRIHTLNYQLDFLKDEVKKNDEKSLRSNDEWDEGEDLYARII
jgi:hypothetical protein